MPQCAFKDLKRRVSFSQLVHWKVERESWQTFKVSKYETQEMSSSAEDNNPESSESSSEITESSSGSDSDDEEIEDQFDQFARYRGTGPLLLKTSVSRQVQPVMCLHYFSNALGLQFGNQNEEVYRLDQIEEWAPPREAKWLEGPSDLLGRTTKTFLGDKGHWQHKRFGQLAKCWKLWKFRLHGVWKSLSKVLVKTHPKFFLSHWKFFWILSKCSDLWYENRRGEIKRNFSARKRNENA